MLEFSFKIFARAKKLILNGPYDRIYLICERLKNRSMIFGSILIICNEILGIFLILIYCIIMFLSGIPLLISPKYRGKIL